MDILDLIFPKSCLQCGKGNKYFCEDCLSKVQVLNQFNPSTNTFSIFKYEKVIKKGILKLKYNFAYDIAKELADVCVKYLKSKISAESVIRSTVLIPIPLHKSRKRWRGFNQSEILGKLIVGKLDWQFNENILIRPIQGKTQVGLKKADRIRNIRGKFTVNPKAKLDQTTTYIIFDDVATTGSTIQEAIKIFKKAGAKKVFGLSIAK